MAISDKHKKLVKVYLSNGMNQVNAMREIGYSEQYALKRGYSIFEREDVKEYIQQQQKKSMEKLDITREDIVKEYLELIESAKIEGVDGEGSVKDRTNWAKALAQLSKLLGLDAPEKKDITITEQPLFGPDKDEEE